MDCSADAALSCLPAAGKRINMKKVIAFIASHFRRDKIWMRRTHPDKRKYQVRSSRGRCQFSRTVDMRC